MSVADSVDVVRGLAPDAKAAGLTLSVTLAASFGCPFEGEVPEANVIGLAREVADLGVDEIALADTIGVGVPAQVRRLLAGVAEFAPGVRTRCHFHNTRNTGYANAIAALEAGVSALDASTGGIGGCPFAPAATGNIATEDLVYLLDRSGVATGVDLAQVIATADWLSGVLGESVPALLGRAGAFPG
jgi:hydroxymethylglutaryl-CoA lyase